MNTLQFPHCDSRVLHQKGECQYCDAHEEWQELRTAWGINFTGYHLKKTEQDTPMLPCPSEIARPLNAINRWDGNVPFKNGQVNSDAPMFQGQIVLHDARVRRVLTYPQGRQIPDRPTIVMWNLGNTLGKLVRWFRR